MKPEEDAAYLQLVNSLPVELRQNVDQLVKIWYQNGYKDGYVEGIKASQDNAKT